MSDSESPAARFRQLCDRLAAAGPVWFQPLYDPASPESTEPIGVMMLSVPALAALCGAGVEPTESELTEWLQAGAFEWPSARLSRTWG